MSEPLSKPPPSVSVSIIVPVYSGEAYLRDLTEVERLRQGWTSSGALLSIDELIFVDDCAVDGSPDLLEQIAKEKPFVRVVHLSRNFGQHAAIVAGVLHSVGDFVVTLDEDLQHPPAAIPAMLRKVAETGCDVVYAAPDSDVHESAFRDFSSRGYKRLIKWLTGNPHIRSVNGFRLVRGAIARGASSVSTHDTFFDVALSWFTQRVEVVPMTLKDRRYIRTGRSGYSLRSLISHARRLLISSQLKVLRLGALIGFFFVLVSVIGGIALFFLKLLVPESITQHGWTSLMLTVTLLGGLTLLLLGILLEYTSILVMRAHGRPLFALRRAFDLASVSGDVQ